MHRRWVVAPSPFGQWGRGPTSNAEVCTDCHGQDGLGPESSPVVVLHVSVPGRSIHGGPVPHPRYGLQIQTQGILGRVPPEARVTVTRTPRTFRFPDGTTVSLRVPAVRVTRLAFGALGPTTMRSPRVAPRLIGLGLLEAIPDEAIEAHYARTAGLATHGRVNRVWDAAASRIAIGRFGWKANQPGIRQQIATALLEDLGVTSSLHPRENCPPVQTACAAETAGSHVDLHPGQLDALVAYLRLSAPPPARAPDDARIDAGRTLFGRTGCTRCHVPEWRTGDDTALGPLAGRTIRPYTDLLVHDMGAGLSDGRPDFDARPDEWRTAPLWGLGVRVRAHHDAALLHDGRARDVTEAILWHGGEAADARERFVELPREARETLVRFVESL
ncbi:MAG: thiol oxidoreductase [Betaproteobacteria bacterium]|nr:thiol oxidoreductase [Betaproteobacteria bacterium]